MAGRIVGDEVDGARLIPMRKMKPLQVGRVASGTLYGNIVLRTASVNQIEVVNLTRMKEAACWTSFGSATPMVEILPQGEKVILELYND